MSQPDDLIKEMQNGSQAAFAKIYESYHKAIYGAIIVIVKESSLAEEILQDVFVKAWNSCSSYKIGKGRFYTWLLAIARNASIDATRSKAFKNSNKNLHDENFVDIIKTHNSLSRQTEFIGVQKYIDALKPVCIELINLLYFNGYTQLETAEKLDTPLGTVKTRIRNCINDLRKMLLDN